MKKYVPTILKYTLYAILGVIIVAHLVCLYFGISWTGTLLCVYALTAWAGIIIINTMLYNSHYKQRVLLMWASLLLSLLVAELSLKYVFKTHLHFLERNGQHLYVSEYRQQIFLKTIARHWPKLVDLKNITEKPNSEKLENKPDFSFLHKYNALGLRGGLPSADTTRAIWIGLGDSFTEGVGAPEDSTWPVLLTQYYNEKHPNSIFCINAGHSGSDPFDAYIALQRLLNYYTPQTVILSINQTDIGDIITKGALDRFNPNQNNYIATPPWWEPIYAFSFICRNIIHASTHVNYYLRTQSEQSDAEQIAQEKLYQLIANNYTALSAQYGFKLIIVFHPFEEELKAGVLTNQTLYNKLKTIHNITTISLLRPFINYCVQSNKPFSTLYWKTDRHHTPQGYALWAKVLCDSIYQQKH